MTAFRRVGGFPAGIGVVAGVCVAMLAALPVPAAAQDGGRGKPSVPLHRLVGSGHIQLDGFVDEPAWEDIDPVPLVMYSPTYGGALTEETEIRIAYDDGYLYVSGRLFDSDLGGIRANSFIRDGFSGDDQFSVVIDSYNDHETAVAFVVNPNGARSDRAVWGDAEWTAGTRPFNSDWNAHWDAAVQRTNDGWSAEMRIPFSTLGFQNAGGEVTMGLSVYRSISRKNERHVYPDISPEYGFFGFGKPSLAQRVTLTDVNRATPMYVTPYLLGGMTQIPTLREPPDVQAAYWATTDDPTGEPGLDFRYSPSSNLSIDLTANTDFAQVEADDQQINLTRFPLFFPEKRQFFQERSATFDFATGGVTDRVFFSRRIGLDQGELVRIYGGARVVGRAGGLDFGMLNMQTAPRAGRPGENMGVLRLKQQIFNQNSSVGGIVTTRVDAYGKTNVAYGADSEVRVFGDEYLTLRWAQSFDDDVAERNPLDAGTFFAQYERRRQEGLNYSAQYRRVGPDYLPRLGFQLRNDFTLFGGSSEYSWFLGEDSQLRAVTVGGTTEHYYRNSDLTPESRSYAPMLRIALKSGTFMTLTSRSSFESIRDPFSVASLQINPGEYWFHEADMSLRLARGGLVRGELGGSAGSFYDGRRVGLRMSPALNVSRHVEIRPGYDLNRFELRGGDYLTTHLAKLGVDFSLDTHLSLSVLAQYNSAADQALVNARFRYHFREGVDLWVVYNEGYYTDRVNGRANNRDPMLPFSSGRALMVKYSHTLAL
ncbi:DUF5916 domain-containing protein [Candidatus Palauibacter sp.]|uniref:DUF5916 domain-containing protein n=1 Tax=Candidatus Palauibacter sp. TaxID=3101350 RepID=UPI003B58C1DF